MSGPKRILLVEDDPMDAEMTLHALATRDLEHEVTHLRDGVEALDYLLRRGSFADRSAGSPAVVLLDLKLPRMDGLEVLQALRASEQFRMLPVVVVTSSAEDRDRDQCYRLGASAYVVKPLDFGAYTQALAETGSFWARINHPPAAGPA